MTAERSFATDELESARSQRVVAGNSLTNVNQNTLSIPTRNPTRVDAHHRRFAETLRTSVVSTQWIGCDGALPNYNKSARWQDEP